MPLILLAPFLTFVLIVSGVRGRRATSNVAMLGLLVTLGAVVLVALARWRIVRPYVITFQWINVPVSFAGATQFQGFGVDISFRIDHLALAAAATLLLATLGVVAWHRFAGRGEAGPARFHAELMLAVGALLGVIVSGDLAALVAWWGLAGAATYLLLAHRWGTEAVGRASRLGLWLPIAGDLALLAGISVLYSRFGQLDVDKLNSASVLYFTYQAGLKSIGLAAVLFGLAALIRAGAFPFTAWQMGVEAPPAVAAWVQGVWPLAALVMLTRILFLFDAAGPQPYRIFAYLCAISAAGALLLGLVLNDIRRTAAWAGAATAALALLGLGQPGALATSIAGMLCLALARPVLTFATWTVAGAMRSVDLLDLGGGWQRMRQTSLGYLVAAAATAVALVPKAAARASAGWAGAWFLGVCLFLLAAALLRPYAAAVHAELRRRRAFEPTRVREAAPGAWAAALAQALAAVVAAVLAFVTAWVAWFGGRGHPGSVEQMLLWLVIVVAGGAAGFAAGGLARDRLGTWSARTQGLVTGYSGLGVLGADRFLLGPLLGAVDAAETYGYDLGGGRLGRAVAAAGGWTGNWAVLLGGGALGLALLVLAVAAVAALLLGVPSR